MSGSPSGILARLEPLCERETGGRVVSIVWRPDSARLVVTGGLGRVQFLRLENVETGPPIVTAWTWDGRCAYGCAACRTWSETVPTAPGFGSSLPALRRATEVERIYDHGRLEAGCRGLAQGAATVAGCLEAHDG